MTLISKIIIPLFVITIIILGIKKKVSIYDEFLTGAKEGINTTLNIFPSILAMIFAIEILLNSNILNLFLDLLTPLLDIFNIPSAIIPLALIRPISGNASLILLNENLKTYGPDSYIGLLSSVIQGCTDTTIYVLALYFGSIKIKNTKHALSTGLFADLMGIIASLIISSFFFQ